MCSGMPCTDMATTLWRVGVGQKVDKAARHKCQQLPVCGMLVCGAGTREAHLPLIIAIYFDLSVTV